MVGVDCLRACCQQMLHEPFGTADDRQIEGGSAERILGIDPRDLRERPDRLFVLFADGPDQQLPRQLDAATGVVSGSKWQGVRYDELATRRGDEWHRFWLAPAHEVPPGGESFVALTQRVHTAILRLSESHRGRDILAVTHGGTIRAALALALNLAPETALSFSIDNLSLTRIDHIPGPGGSRLWRVATVNQPPS